MRDAGKFSTGVILGAALILLMAVKVLAADDAELIAKAVQAEAGNQDFEGRRLVAATVLNRVDSEVFPDTVEGVLYQPGQFSTAGKLATTEPTWMDRLAVKMEIESRSNTDVMFFRAGRYGCGEPLMQVGDHYFSGLKE